MTQHWQNLKTGQDFVRTHILFYEEPLPISYGNAGWFEASSAEGVKRIAITRGLKSGQDFVRTYIIFS